jgi:hypothetical protein
LDIILAAHVPLRRLCVSLSVGRSEHAMLFRIQFAVLLSISTMLVAGTVRAADAVGRVCITPIPMGERWDANDSGAKESSVFSVQIDKLPAIQVTTNTSGVFTNLSLASEHLVKIRLDGKALTSFRFSFEGRGDHLRLWYNPFYGSWSLSDVHPGEKCSCPKTKASNKPAAPNAGIASVPDVPLPASTPYDGNPKARTAYLEGYRLGYKAFVADRAVGGPDVFSDDPVAKARMFGWYDGYQAADVAAKLQHERHEAAKESQSR